MLSSEQKRFFQKNGYFVIENVLDQIKVLDPVRAEYVEILDRLYAGWFDEGRVEPSPDKLSFHDKLLVSYRAGCDWFQPMDISLPGGPVDAATPMHFGPAVFEMVTHQSLLDLVQDLIGPEISSNPIQHVRIKPPMGDLKADEIRAHITSTDWHQDMGVALEAANDTQMITAWCAVSDSTLENGCLQVIPGTHRQGILPHCPKVQTAIADGYIDERKAVPLPVRSGGVVILHPLLAHGSLVNTTETFRWSFDLRYHVIGHNSGRDHFPEFIARSLKNPAAVLTDHNKWREMWETTRSNLSSEPHINIHRWSGNSPACA